VADPGSDHAQTLECNDAALVNGFTCAVICVIERVLDRARSHLDAQAGRAEVQPGLPDRLPHTDLGFLETVSCPTRGPSAYFCSAGDLGKACWPTGGCGSYWPR
jgi:hypothetical protein